MNQRFHINVIHCGNPYGCIFFKNRSLFTIKSALKLHYGRTRNNSKTDQFKSINFIYLTLAPRYSLANIDQIRPFLWLYTIKKTLKSMI